jgi:hypothetical protein
MPRLTRIPTQQNADVEQGTSLLLTQKLNLPAVRKFTPLNPSGYYGSLALAAAYCGLDSIPEDIRGFWPHGWSPEFWQLDPVMITGLDEDVRHKNSSQYWVTRQDEASYLRRCGYKHVTAIGLPIVYHPQEETRRKPGSLLVMPAHSLEYTTHDWKFAEYADEIAKIKDRFSDVVICVHPSCWKRGYWVDDFKQRGFEVVQGALVDDLNALIRIQRLLAGFEYVTTNYFGSHVVYAAFLGAKVSVFGPYAELKAEDFAKTPFYLDHPQVLEHTLRVTSETEMRRVYPDLFCFPWQAQQRVEWGRHEVGYDNKVSPRKMRSLFRWRLHDRATARVSSFFAGATHQIWASLPWRVRHVWQLAVESEYRRKYIKTRWPNRRTHNS